MRSMGRKYHSQTPLHSQSASQSASLAFSQTHSQAESLAVSDLEPNLEPNQLVSRLTTDGKLLCTNGALVRGGVDKVAVPVGTASEDVDAPRNGVNMRAMDGGASSGEGPCRRVSKKGVHCKKFLLFFCDSSVPFQM